MSPVGVRRTQGLTVVSVEAGWDWNMLPTQENGAHLTGAVGNDSLEGLYKQNVSELLAMGYCPSYHACQLLELAFFFAISRCPSPCPSSRHCLSPVPAQISPEPPSLFLPESPAAIVFPTCASFSELPLEELLLPFFPPARSIPSPKAPGPDLLLSMERESPRGNQAWKSGGASCLWAHPSNMALRDNSAQTHCLHLEGGNGAARLDPTKSFIVFNTLR